MVGLVLRRGGGEGGELADQGSDLAGAVERLAAPRRRVVAPLGDLPGGGGEAGERRVAEAGGEREAARRAQRLGAGARASWIQRSKVRWKSADASSSSSSRKSGSIPASTGRSRNSSAQKEWMVPMRASSRRSMAFCRQALDGVVALAAAAIERLAQP